MANVIFNHAKLLLIQQSLNFDTDTIRAMLMDADYTPDIDLDFVDDGAGTSQASANEVSGTGYVAGHGNSGRQLITNISVVEDLTNDRIEMQVSTDNTWTGINVTGDISGVLIIREGTSNDSDAVMIAFIDTVAGGSPESFPIATTGNDLRIEWNDEGMLQLT